MVGGVTQVVGVVEVAHVAPVDLPPAGLDARAPWCRWELKGGLAIDCTGQQLARMP